MATARRSVGPRGPAPAASHRSVRTASKLRKHRIVLETVTQEKKMLRSVLSFKTEPPPGYTFIPAGNPELTNALKEAAREENYHIYAVTTTPHQKVHNLSKEVHRVGFHFPSTIVNEVCAQYGISLTAQGTIINPAEAESFRQRRKQRGKGQDDDNLDQITVNTRAKQTIKDLFPNIPDNDLFQIIKTAFQKGKGKVGTANELTLVRRAQLSVVAHIRHVYTNYDRLLRTVGYHDARGKVEGPTLKKLVEWRGDDESGKKVLEDVFREVIVISDDDDSDEDMDDVPDMRITALNDVDGRQRERRQIIDLQPVSIREQDPNHYSDDEVSSGYRLIPQVSRRTRTIDLQPVDRNGPNRYEAWDRAREQYRKNPDYVAIGSEYARPGYDRPDFDFNRPPSNPFDDRVPEPRTLTFKYPEEHLVHSSSPTSFRAADGALYTRVVTRRQDDYEYDPRFRSRQPTPPPPRATYQGLQHVSSRPDSPPRRFQRESTPPRRTDEVILPSIEGMSPPVLREPAKQWQSIHSEPRRSDALHQYESHIPQSTTHREVIDLTVPNDHHSGKRRRDDDPAPDPIRNSGAADSRTQRGDFGYRRVEYISFLPSPHDSLPRNQERAIVDLSSQRPLPRFVGYDNHGAKTALSSSMLHVPAPREVSFPDAPEVVRHPRGQPPVPLQRVYLSDSASYSPRLLLPPRERYVELSQTDGVEERYASVRDRAPLEAIPVDSTSRQFFPVSSSRMPTELVHERGRLPPLQTYEDVRREYIPMEYSQSATELHSSAVAGAVLPRSPTPSRAVHSDRVYYDIDAHHPGYALKIDENDPSFFLPYLLWRQLTFD